MWLFYLVGSVEWSVSFTTSASSLPSPSTTHRHCRATVMCPMYGCEWANIMLILNNKNHYWNRIEFNLKIGMFNDNWLWLPQWQWHHIEFYLLFFFSFFFWFSSQLNWSKLDSWLSRLADWFDLGVCSCVGMRFQWLWFFLNNLRNGRFDASLRCIRVWWISIWRMPFRLKISRFWK